MNLRASDSGYEAPQTVLLEGAKDPPAILWLYALVRSFGPYGLGVMRETFSEPGESLFLVLMIYKEALCIEGTAFSKGVYRQPYGFVGAVNFTLKLPFPAVEHLLSCEFSEVPLLPAQLSLDV
jgi:hypothetical protein